MKEFKDHTSVTENGNVFYEKVIFATHFPIDNKHGIYFMKMYQERSYVLALAEAAQVQGMYLNDLITFSKKRCPHLGCALRWNREEHTWDCPCHGSRFDEEGRMLDNPATGDLPD